MSSSSSKTQGSTTRKNCAWSSWLWQELCVFYAHCVWGSGQWQGVIQKVSWARSQKNAGAAFGPALWTDVPGTDVRARLGGRQADLGPGAQDHVLCLLLTLEVCLLTYVKRWLSTDFYLSQTFLVPWNNLIWHPLSPPVTLRFFLFLVA